MSQKTNTEEWSLELAKDILATNYLNEKDFEKRIKFGMMSPEAVKTGPVEVYFMPCTSETDYCTEIHVMHHDLSDEDQLFYKGFWQRKLNELRQLCNGDWVIEDRDLSLSALKSSF